MESFSQRKGIKSARTEIQRESMDDDLRTGLWNVLYTYYFSKTNYFMGNFNQPFATDEQLKLTKRIWCFYFKRPIDELKPYSDRIEHIRDYFNKCEWNEVHDLIEFVVRVYNDEDTNEKFRSACNDILKLYLSAHRFVGDEFIEITSEEEIAEIESALQIPVSEIQVHLNCALGHLSNRTNPDYRNSIKESISAVESICISITKNNKATLGEALKEIETKLNIGLHPALRGAFSKLYGYTSNADGIRHALTDESNLYAEDARFMLVTCSAFINYLTEKASKAGINLQ